MALSSRPGRGRSCSCRRMKRGLSMRVAPCSAPPVPAPTMVRWPPHERMQARPVGPGFTATWPTSTPARFMDEMKSVPHCRGEGQAGRAGRAGLAPTSGAGKSPAASRGQQRAGCNMPSDDGRQPSMQAATHLVKASDAQQLRGHAKARQPPRGVGGAAACPVPSKRGMKWTKRDMEQAGVVPPSAAQRSISAPRHNVLRACHQAGLP